MSKDNLFDTRPSVRTKLNRLPPNPEADDPNKAVGTGRFPSWLHRKLPKGNTLAQTGNVLTSQRLHTVCEEAKCPNLLECWSKKTATFLIMGKECTRSCGFCSIDFSKNPKPLDPEEPKRIAESVRELNLKHVVITQVARDDLDDGGASHLVAVIHEIRSQHPTVTIEVLTSDFHGNENAWEVIIEARPEVFNYNIETVRELTPRVRHKASYERTLAFLSYMKSCRGDSGMLIKSGLMVGLGETEEQVKETIRDLHAAGVDMITIGQYLQSSRRKLDVKAFVTPAQFTKYEEYGYEIGVKHMFCGPFVRSSYHAGIEIKKIR